VIKQRLNCFDKAQRVRQRRVMLERSFVSPSRMQIKELRIARGAKRIQAHAPRLGTCRGNDLAQCSFDRAFVTRPGMKTREYIQLHGYATKYFAAG